MNIKDKERMHKQVDAWYQRQLDVLDAKRRNAHEGIDAFFLISQETNNSDFTYEPKPVQTRKREKRGTLDAAVRDVIPSIPGDIDINVVIQRITETHPEIKQPIVTTSVSGILRELVDEGIIELLEKGQGKRPSRYRMLSQPREPNEERSEEIAVAS